MAFVFKESETDAKDLYVPEIPANHFKELPDDSGEIHYKSDLPDDSGSSPSRLELSDDAADLSYSSTYKERVDRTPQK